MNGTILVIIMNELRTRGQWSRKGTKHSIGEKWMKLGFRAIQMKSQALRPNPPWLGLPKACPSTKVFVSIMMFHQQVFNRWASQFRVLIAKTRPRESPKGSIIITSKIKVWKPLGLLWWHLVESTPTKSDNQGFTSSMLWWIAKPYFWSLIDTQTLYL